MCVCVSGEDLCFRSVFWVKLRVSALCDAWNFVLQCATGDALDISEKNGALCFSSDGEAPYFTSVITEA